MKAGSSIARLPLSTAEIKDRAGHLLDRRVLLAKHDSYSQYLGYLVAMQVSIVF